MPVGTSSIDALPGAVATWRPDALVSVTTPGLTPLTIPGLPRLDLAFPDTEAGGVPGCTTDDVLAFVRFHAAHRGRRLLIHCTAGLSRSPALAILACMLDGMTAGDSAGPPTGQFVMESQGVWAYTDGNSTGTGIAGTPRFAMAERLELDIGTGLLFADYAGQEVSRCSYPVVNGASTSNVVALPSDEALVVPANRYASSVYSVDYGKSWLPLTLWSGRGTTKPGIPDPAVNDLVNAAAMRPLFVT